MQSKARFSDQSAIVEDKLNFNTRVMAALRKMRRSKAWLAEQIGIPRQVLQYLLSDSVKKPKYISEIAQALEVDPGFLLYGSEQETVLKKNLCLLPVLTTAQLAQPDRVHRPIDQIPFYCDDRKAYFVMLLEEESMTPFCVKGSYLIFKKDQAIKDGCYCLIKTEQDEILLRQALKDGDDFIYKAINLGFKTIHSVSGVLGILLETRVNHC